MTVKGLVFQGVGTGISATGGRNHVIEGNRFGTSADGSTGTGIARGIVVNTAGVTIADNVFVGPEGVVADTAATGLRVRDNRFGTNAAGTAALGTGGNGTPLGLQVGAADAEVTGNQFVGEVGVVGGTGASGLSVSTNRFGTNASGTAVLGDSRAGVIVLGPNASIRGNQAATKTVGFAAIGTAAGGAQIADNAVGVDAARTASLPHVGLGIRIDGAPGAQVTGNVIGSSGGAAISITGSVQVRTVGNETRFNGRDEVVAGPVTGGGTVVRGNTIGLLAGGTTLATDPGPYGVEVFADAPNVTIASNTMAGSAAPA